jgi:hypothetical protein
MEWSYLHMIKHMKNRNPYSPLALYLSSLSREDRLGQIIGIGYK